jgi:hypothetical protein
MNTIFADSSSGDDIPDVARQQREIARLQEDNEDLRASAAHWRRLYDAAPRPTNDLEGRADQRVLVKDC